MNGKQTERNESRASWRQLEQQRSELSFSLSEQQQSRQCQQQYRVPGCLRPLSQSTCRIAGTVNRSVSQPCNLAGRIVFTRIRLVAEIVENRIRIFRSKKNNNKQQLKKFKRITVNEK